MQRDKLDFGNMAIGPLFRAMFFPTLVGMIFTSIITVVDGMFVGRGVGAPGIAAVNIVAPTFMVATGIGLMFGIGASVIAGIRLSEDNVKAARIILTQGFVASSLLALAMVIMILVAPDATLQLLGCSDLLKSNAMNYMLPLTPALLFVMVQCIGMMLIRLDGSPKYAMLCQAVPAVLNIVLDYIMIFPMQMGVKGASVATSISCVVGGLMALVYFFWFSDKLRFYRLKLSRKSLKLSLRNVGYMGRIGFATFLTEVAMSVMMLTGNYMFMKRLGENGVAAYSIACYLFPVVFSIANAVAQSAQPIISFNYGAGSEVRVTRALKVALFTALICGVTVTAGLALFTRLIVGAFLSPGQTAYDLAVGGLPLFATCAVFFAVNITFIGFYQSIERAWRSIAYTLLRGIVLLIPSFLLLPGIVGNAGLWCAIPVAEIITTAIIVMLFIAHRKRLAALMTRR
ncbi:MAG: MATE family efflux transporter [Muribaculaceae bacterium]|nr:MATE family efflux transporter [Muribaculaceae bacterium]